MYTWSNAGRGRRLYYQRNRRIKQSWPAFVAPMWGTLSPEVQQFFIDHAIRIPVTTYAVGRRQFVGNDFNTTAYRLAKEYLAALDKKNLK